MIPAGFQAREDEALQGEAWENEAWENAAVLSSTH